MDEHIEYHFKNRRKGFYLWTTKKNFLSCHIYHKYKNKILTRDEFFKIFEKVLQKIKDENNIELKKKCIYDWNHFRFNYYSENPRYFNYSLSYFNNLKPRNILDFLYKKKYSYEELICFLSIDANHDKLFQIGLEIFTIISEQIDDYNSHCSKIYMEQVYYPISSLQLSSNFYYFWNSLIV